MDVYGQSGGVAGTQSVDPKILYRVEAGLTGTALGFSIRLTKLKNVWFVFFQCFILVFLREPVTSVCAGTS